MDKRTRTQSLALCALMTALLCVCAQIQLPLPGVPVSMALFAVHLSAMLLGPGRAAASAAAYLLLGLCGLPVFAGFASGPAALFGPTGGFLLAYPLCALVTGALCGPADGPLARRVLAGCAGLACCMIPGVLWLTLSTGRDATPAFFLWQLAYLPGDLAKIVLAALLSRRLHQALRPLLP